MGEEREITFTGRSQVVRPDGRILIRVEEESQGVWTVECDPLEAQNKMVTERNDIFQDRRKDLYRIKVK